MNVSNNILRTASTQAQVIVVCDHASNHIPAALNGLGLSPEAQVAHIAWDPSALGVSRALSSSLSAPPVAANISRMVYDLEATNTQRQCL